MSETRQANLISVVVPIYNESQGLKAFHTNLLKAVATSKSKKFEIIYVDDGSTDLTAELIANFHRKNSNIKLIKFSRNFGKENALSAGIKHATGQAIITIDGDGQHPVEMIEKFIREWEKGYQVVIGVRTDKYDTILTKRIGSKVFYKSFNKVTQQKLIPGSTDFRLIDKAVQEEFLKMKESDRITRGLIDWLGFKRQLIPFDVVARGSGSPGYSLPRLVRLAANSFVSLTPYPLYFFGVLGIFITTGALILGLAIIIEQLLMGDPLSWEFSGTAMLGTLTLFLIGTVLLSQGILSLYISHIHTQSKQRPLYVINHKESLGIE